MNGNWNKTVFVDLDTGEISIEEPGEELYRAFLGGYGLMQFRIKLLPLTIETFQSVLALEQLRDGLRVAFKKMKWSRDAHRFVILIGDAPPHRRDYGRIQKLVGQFVRSRTMPSKVSTIYTGSTYSVDIEVTVDGTLTVHDGHVIAHRVEADGGQQEAHVPAE